MGVFIRARAGKWTSSLVPSKVHEDGRLEERGPVEVPVLLRAYVKTLLHHNGTRSARCC